MEVTPRVGVPPRPDVRRRPLQWQGDLGAGARDFDDGGLHAELGVRAELSRATGVGAEFVPDRGSGASRRVQADPLFGTEWRFGYSFASRTFPDSSSRDHLEHGSRRGCAGRTAGHSLDFESEAARRSTVRSCPPAGTTARGPGGAHGGRGSGTHGHSSRGGSWSPPTTTRGQLALFRLHGWSRPARGGFETEWAVTAGPRGEVLTAASLPLSAIGDRGVRRPGTAQGGAWWSLTPAGGWRDYEEVPPADLAVLHSSYASPKRWRSPTSHCRDACDCARRPDAARMPRRPRAGRTQSLLLARAA